MLHGCTPWPTADAARYRLEGYWGGIPLGELPRDWARRYGDRTALVHGDRRISYATLDTWVDRIAAGLRSYGLEAGDRVVVQLPNVPEFVAVCLALARLRTPPVFAVPAYRGTEIRYLAEASGAVAYVVPGVYRGFDHAALGRELVDELPALRHVFTLGGEDGCVPLSDVDSERVPLTRPDPGEVAFFLLSGGTTALPKLIPRTHDDYVYQVRASARLCGLTERDVYLVALPIQFNFAWGCPGVLGTLRAGGTVVLAENPSADTCFRLIERERVTFTSLVPSIARLWVDEAAATDRDLSSLRFVQIGGARLHAELARRIEPDLGARLQQVFGMAEGLLTFSRPDDPLETVHTTQGRPLSPADEIRVVDDAGIDVAPGQVGQLLARGPYTIRGYFRADAHNRRAFTPDGFYRTGDLVRLTGTGDLVVEGRIKDVVIRGGDKISAPELEGFLAEHPNIAQVAVIGVPDEVLGERTCACVVACGEPPTLGELRRMLHENGLAAYKFPDRVEIVDAMPLTALGKFDKTALAADIVRRITGTPPRKVAS